MRRHVGTNPYRELYLKEVEMEAHIFFDCLFFSAIWSREPFHLSLEFAVPNFATGLRWLKDQLEDMTFALACVVCWNKWNVHGFDSLLHSSEIGDRESFVSRSRDFLASFTSSRIQFKVPNLMQHTGTWSPAIAPLIKINFDIAVYDAGYYQVGLVACDSTGELVVWSHER